MRKRIPLLPVLVAVVLTMSASVAQAGSFVLTLDDLGDGVGVNVVTIAGSDDPLVNPDTLSFVGTVGSFNIMGMSANLSNPGVSAPIQMKFTNFLVSSQTKGTLRATLTGTDLYSAALGTSVLGTAIAGVTITGTGNNATFQGSIDGTSVYSRTFPGVAPLASSALGVGSDVDLVAIWDFNFAGGGTMMGSSDLRVSSAPVPEPMTLLLFGPGLAGLVALRRRRRSKAL